MPLHDNSTSVTKLLEKFKTSVLLLYEKLFKIQVPSFLQYLMPAICYLHVIYMWSTCDAPTTELYGEKVTCTPLAWLPTYLPTYGKNFAITKILQRLRCTLMLTIDQVSQDSKDLQ